jgi:hypothetical protein
MDIIFQSGEFYNESSSWTVLLDPLATLIAVLLSGWFGVKLFNKGIQKDRTLANEQRERDYKHNEQIEIRRREEQSKAEEKKREICIEKFGQLFNALFSNTIESTIKQLLFYKEYIERVELDLMGLHHPVRVTQENLKRILKLNIQEILDYFEYKGLNNNDFIKTLSQLDYLHAEFELITNELLKDGAKSIESLSNDAIRIRQLMLNFMVEYLNNQKRDNPDYKKDVVFIAFNELVSNYYENFDGVPKISWDYEKLFLASKKSLLDEPFRFIPECKSILNFAKEGGDISFSIKQFNQNTSNLIKDKCKKIETSLEMLSEINSKIK